MMSLPVLVRSELPTSHHKDRTTSLVVSRCDCSLPQCVHAFLILPLFVCQNSASHYTNSDFLDHYSGRSTNFYLDHHKTVTCFFSPWHHRIISFRVNQSHYNLFCMSWRVCLYAFLALRLPRPLTCAHIRVRRHLPRRFHYFPAHRLLWFPPAVFSWGLWPPARQHVPGVQAPDPLPQQVLACSSCSTTPQATATRTKQVELGIAQPFQAAGLHGDPIGWECVKIPWMPVPALRDIWRRPAPLAALLQAVAASEDWPLQAGDAAGLRCWFSALLSVVTAGTWFHGLASEFWVYLEMLLNYAKKMEDINYQEWRHLAKGGQVRQTGPFSCLRSHPSCSGVSSRDEHFLSK